jgi:PAS domain S-box-containing protein
LRYRWQHQDGYYIWIEVQARFFADVSGNLTRMIGYVTDISEKIRLEADRTQLETALRESEAQLRQIFDNSKDVFFLKSLDGKQMVYTSPAWEDLYQTPLQQTYDNPHAWLDFVHPADRDRMSRFNQQMCQGETFEPCEYRIVRPDGSARWLWTRTFPIRNEAGEAYRVAGINTDITDRKQAEEALQKSQQRLRLAIQAAKIGYWQLDLIQETLVASSQCKANFGLSPEDDFSYARLFELMHPHDRAHVVEQVQQAIATHTDYQAEYRIIWPNGEIHWTYALGKATYNLDGSPLEMSGITLNISDRKRAELELQASEARFRTLADNISQFAWMTDENGWIFWYNQRWFDYTGTTLEEMQGWGWQQVLHPDHVDRVVEKISGCFETGETWEDTFPLRGRDGQYRWFLSRAIPIRDEQGKVLRWFGTNTDITELQQTKMTLQQTTERLNIALKSAPLTLFNQDLELRYTWVYNPTHNYSVEQILGQRDEDLLSAETAARLTQLKRQVLETGIGCREEVSVIRDEQANYYDLAIEPIRNSENLIVGITCAGVDVTDHKQAEAELRESEELNQRILESSQDSIKVLTLEGNLLYINAGGVCSLEDDSSLLANTNWISLWRGDVLNQAEAAIAAAKAGKMGRFSGYRPTLKATPKWWDVAVTPLRDAAGQVIKLVVVSRDITEQKQAEVALRESEQTLSQVMNTLPGAVYKYRRSANAADHFVFLSQGIVDLYEQKPEEILNNSSIAWDIILPEDVEGMSASIDRSAATLEPWKFEFRIRTASGVLKWILGHSIPSQQEDGSIIWCGILTDISDRKRSEQALRESEQRYRDLAEAMPQMVWLADTTGSVYYFNQRWYDYTGLSEAESMGLGAVDAIHPDERDRTLQEWAQATTTSTIFDSEYRLRHHEGLYRWFIVRGLPIQNLVGDITGWVSTLTDIDDFKRAVLAQQQSEARFRAVFEQAAVGIVEVDIRGRFLRGNQCYCDFLGYSEAELLERDFQNLTPDANELVLDVFHNQQLLASKLDSFTIENRMLCKNGELRWCQVTVSPVFNVSGTIAYYLAIVQDIQDRKQAELARQASEARLNDVLSSAGASIGHFRLYENGAWETEYHSTGSEQIFGYAPDDFLAETWLSGITAEDWHVIHKPMLAAIKAETEITLEYRFYHPDGSTRWISDTVTSHWHEDDRCWVVTVIATNISDRKLAEQALQQLNHELEARIIQRTAALSESEMRYRALFEQAAVGISQCHPSGTYLQVNQRFCDLTGYAQAELLKMSWRDLIHPDDLTVNQIQLTQLYQGELASMTAESRYIRKDGQPQWVSFTVSLLYDVAGAPISDLTVVEDISDRKEIEHRLQTSEKRLKEIISKTVDGILILNPHGQILFGNPAAEKIFDCQQPYCQGALLGVPITLEKTFELDIPHRDGSLRTVEVRIEEITWQDKKAFLAAARDISQRKQDQIALQASELSYRTLAENLPGLVYTLYPSQNNKLVLFNDRLTTLYQLNPADLAKQNSVCPMSLLIVPEDHDRVIETIQAAITNQQPFQIEYGIYIPTTQEKRYLLEQGSTAIDAIGQTLHIVGVIFDVTNTKRTEEELRKINERLTITNAELARATRLKDEFLANMSHELRTPLNSVLGLSEVLQERIYGDLTEQQQRALNTIQINGQHLLVLINDILDLAKIESGKLELQMAPVSAQQLCQSTIPFIQQQAFRKQISFTLNLPSDLAYIEVDERLIRQALLNLLSNAVKFTPSGGSVTLTVEGNAAEQSLSFSVIDTGIGIATENIDKLFQPFVQIDSSLSRHYSGTGLGLALVRRIVELHKGIVTIRSTIGQGSQFTVLLPWKHANSPNRAKILSDTVTAAKTGAKSLPIETQHAVKKPIVLLVEDNLDNIETLTAYLNLKGFEIVVARNGLQATQLAQAQSFNLILMDIQMPGMDGLEAIRQIRSQEQDRHIPILAVTALAMPEDEERCLAAGADDYLTKPISPIYLVSTMKKYLQLP